MFGVSFLELVIVGIVAFFVMQPKDIRRLVYWYKYIFKKVMELRGLAQESIDEINRYLEENDSDAGVVKRDYVIDANNGLHKVCDTDPLVQSSSRSEADG
jgi:Sec-independent protein translocase protein TatA